MTLVSEDTDKGEDDEDEDVLVLLVPMTRTSVSPEHPSLLHFSRKNPGQIKF